jgi:hypothetical protein
MFTKRNLVLGSGVLLAVLAIFTFRDSLNLQNVQGSSINSVGIGDLRVVESQQSHSISEGVKAGLANVGFGTLRRAENVVSIPVTGQQSIGMGSLRSYEASEPLVVDLSIYRDRTERVSQSTVGMGSLRSFESNASLVSNLRGYEARAGKAGQSTVGMGSLRYFEGGAAVGIGDLRRYEASH